MTAVAAAYRAAAALVGAAAPLVRGLGGPGTAWRGSLTGGSAELDRAAGSVWIHAASMGEVVAARVWVRALIGSGHRPPLLVTTRTARGLERARRELGEEVVARVAPLDAPQLLRSFLARAAPWRLDIVETEIWPHLISESRRASVAVVFVSAAVSERTRRALLRWGIAGPRLLGEGVWALTQTDEHAERFVSLGVPSSRVAVVGDLKAEPPTAGAARDAAVRPLVVFGSLRPGEEDVAIGLARAIARDETRALVAAPRHRDGFERLLAACASAGLATLVRTEASLGAEDLESWIRSVADSRPRRVGILATQGELPRAYESAAVAVVGGTFAPFGGHSALEPAARGSALFVGPHTGAIRPAIELLAREDAVIEAAGAAAAADALEALLRSPERITRMGAGAVRAASQAALAPSRALDALATFGLTP